MQRCTSDAVLVIVDSTLPVATLTLPGGGYLRPGPDATIQLTGAATDPSGGPLRPAAGVERVQISVDGQAWKAVEVTNNGTWSFGWQPGGTPWVSTAQGQHQVSVRAIDRAGNVGTPETRTIVIDKVAPTDALTTGFLDDTPQVLIGQPITITGRANDAGRVALPSRPAPLAGTLDVIAKATTWLEPGSTVDYSLGATVSWLGDVNGDGRADLAVGLPGSTGPAGAAYAGRVALVYGRGGDWPVAPNAQELAESPSQLVGAAGAQLGRSVAGADVDGDGKADLIVGDPVNARVFVFFGWSAPFGRDLILDGRPRTGQVILNAPGLRFAAAAGDVNGDGLGDLLIGAGESVYLVLGEGNTWPATLNVTDRAAAVVSQVVEDRAVGIGDADGDGLADFAVTDSTGRLGGGSAVYVFRGRSSFGPSTRASLGAASGAYKFTGPPAS